MSTKTKLKPAAPVRCIRWLGDTEGQALPRPTAAGWWWATLDIESDGYWCLFNVWKKEGRWVATSATAEGCPVRYRRVDAYIREEWRWWVGPLASPVSPNDKISDVCPPLTQPTEKP